MNTRLTSMEKTFSLIKPDGLARGLAGEIFKRFEDAGLKLVASRMIQPTQEQARSHYPHENLEWVTGLGQKTWDNYNGDENAIYEDLGTTDKHEIGMKVYEGLVRYLTEGPIILMVWEGNHAVMRVQQIAGKTDPTRADLGSIRGIFGFDTPQLAVKSGRVVFKNLIHISDSPEEAEREIKHWFQDSYTYLGEYERIDYIDML